MFGLLLAFFISWISIVAIMSFGEHVLTRSKKIADRYYIHLEQNIHLNEKVDQLLQLMLVMDGSHLNDSITTRMAFLLNEVRDTLHNQINMLQDRGGELLKDTIIEEADRLVRIQKNIGIAGLALLGILLVVLPVYLYNQLNNQIRRAARMYRSHFHQEMVFSKKKPLEKMEELIEKIIREAGAIQEK